MSKIAALAAASVSVCATLTAQIPSDVEIQKILAERVGPVDAGSALVVGVIDAKGRRVITYGSLAKGDTRRLDGNTVFEMGSVTKVFTSLVLMDMVRKGEVAVDDPISKYLPASVKVPERNNRKITFADLSTQSSGLPRLPANLNPKDPNNPYADYTVQQLYDFLFGYTLTRDIGSQYEYSNLGVGLLGHVLALRAGAGYEAMVRARILAPLKMTDTSITLTPDTKARLATGHSATLEPAENWDLPTLAGAGALRSTANDMLTFLAANLGYTKTPLSEAMADEVSIRRPISPGMEIAYAWHVQTKDGKSIIWHDGGTGGYVSYIAFDSASRTGVVLLANVFTAAGVADIGRHILDSTYPLLKVAPPVQRKQITLDTKVFDRYVGQYQISPYSLLSISREDSRFYVQLTGQMKIEIFPENDRNFFLKAVDAQLTFDADASHVTLHQNGRDIAGARVTAEEARKVEAALDARKAEAANRQQSNTPAPGTEDAVRRILGELQRGEPDYAKMSDPLTAVTKQQLPQLKQTLAQLGALQSVTFNSVGPNGVDTYDVKFEHGGLKCVVLLGPDGKTYAFGMQPQ